MTHERLSELRQEIIVHLYRVNPLGRSAAKLQRLIQKQEFPCTEDEINAQLAMLAGLELVKSRPADTLAPGLPPFWFITSKGMLHAEEQHIVG